MEWSIRGFHESDTEAVVALWHEAGLTRPWNDPYADIQRKRAVQPELFLVAVDRPRDDHQRVEGEGRVIGTVMGGYDGHRGWLYYLATAESHRGIGVARSLVEESERLLHAMGCPKVQLMIREGNEGVLAFYDALGYEPFRVANMGKRLVVDA